MQSLEAEKEYRVSKKLGEPADAMKHRSLRERASDLGSKVSCNTSFLLSSNDQDVI